MWLYFRFALSYRDVEELLAERGVVLIYETVRQWCRKFGQQYANALRHHRPRPGDKWHLDEVFITINGQTHYLWRAVDQDGTVLDVLVQARCDKRAAMRFLWVRRMTWRARSGGSLAGTGAAAPRAERCGVRRSARSFGTTSDTPPPALPPGFARHSASGEAYEGTRMTTGARTAGRGPGP